MFDRIAGVYDLMNSVMTAGLHHRWRERAADLAALKPGDRALDVATRDRRPRGRARPARRAGAARSSGRTSRRGCSTRARAEGRRAALGVGATRSRSPTRTTRFDAATVGFGARNFSDLDRGLAEMARVVRPGGRVVVLEITTPQRPPLSKFFSIWFDRIVPALGKVAGDPDAYTYLPNSVKRFPGPEALGGAMARGGPDDVRWILTAGGIIALHSGTVRVSSAEQVLALVEAGGAHVPALMARLEERLPRRWRLARRAARRARGRDDPRRRQAAAAAAGLPRRGRAARHGDDGMLRAAVAVELIHSATLVHDDVLDGAAAAPRAADGRRRRRPRDGDRDRRPAVLARVRRAGRQRPRRRGARALRRVVGARRGRAAAARGRLERRRGARALPAPLRPQDRAPVPGRVRARRARGRRARPRRSAASAAGSGSRSSCSTTCSTCPGRPSGPASTAARTCSTARSRCR